MYSLIVTAKMNAVDPQAWLADVLGKITQHPINRLAKLLPWKFQPLATAARQAALRAPRAQWIDTVSNPLQCFFSLTTGYMLSPAKRLAEIGDLLAGYYLSRGIIALRIMEAA